MRKWGDPIRGTNCWTFQRAKGPNQKKNIERKIMLHSFLSILIGCHKILTNKSALKWV